MKVLSGRRGVVIGVAGLALAVRLALMPRYYGWEESDYGNLAMVRGVLESGFRHYDMNHLPLYYGLSALVMALTGDAVLATRAVSLLGGVATVALATWLADRLLGRRAAIGAGLAMAAQPELALYSASSLREPLYAACVMAALASLCLDRLARGSAFVGLAFLTRMDALVALAPALAVRALERAPRLSRAARAAGPLAGATGAWMLYCRVVHGTWAFWGHSVAVNVETGSAEATHAAAWLLDGLRVSLALWTEVLPSRVGWAIWAGHLVALALTPWTRPDPRRTLALGSLGLLAFWLGVALIAQHEPGHNLYWKWLHAVLPPFIVLGVGGALAALDRLATVIGRPGAVALGLLAAAEGGRAMQLELRRQLAVSEALYRPQLELARAIEASAAPGEAMLVDNIPGCWLDRRDHGLTLHSWFDVPVPPGDKAAFLRWVEAQRLTRVVWFAEPWTQAPVVAPWLGEEAVHVGGGVRLVPTAREPGYGWIHYEVRLDAEAPHGG